MTTTVVLQPGHTELPDLHGRVGGKKQQTPSRASDRTRDTPQSNRVPNSDELRRCKTASLQGTEFRKEPLQGRTRMQLPWMRLGKEAPPGFLALHPTHLREREENPN